MPAKIKVMGRGSLKKLVRDTGLAYISAAKVIMDRSVLSEMKQGKSPVKGGRWDKPYSKSYQATLKGEKTFRTMNGKVVAFDSPDLNIVGIGKKLSPVNLKLSGQLHASFQSLKRGFTLFMEFKDKVADYHNRLGAGKAKAIRRMLPTNSGEEFNDRIDKQLSKALVNAVRKAIKKYI